MARKSDNGNGNGSSEYHVPNLERALDILELLTRNPEGLNQADIVRELGITTNMMYRIARTLDARGYLERDADTKRFRLGAKLLGLGRASVDQKSLVESGWDVMRELRERVQESVFIGCRHGNEGVILQDLPGLHPFILVVHPGTRFPFYCTAPGKVMMAFSDDRKRLIETSKLERLTATTITSRTALAEEVDSIRQRGYAIDRAEGFEGVHCAAAPIFDHEDALAGVLWFVGPSQRLPMATVQKLGPVVMEHANRISHRLGNRHNSVSNAAS
jgi:DNA-binding IclR family transcriptional regulator